MRDPDAKAPHVVPATLVARCWLISVGVGAALASLVGVTFAIASGSEFTPPNAISAIEIGLMILVVAVAVGMMPALALVGIFAVLYRRTGLLSRLYGALAGGAAIWLGALLFWPGASTHWSDIPAGLAFFAFPSGAAGFAAAAYARHYLGARGLLATDQKDRA